MRRITITRAAALVAAAAFLATACQDVDGDAANAPVLIDAASTTVATVVDSTTQPATQAPPTAAPDTTEPVAVTVTGLRSPAVYAAAAVGQDIDHSGQQTIRLAGAIERAAADPSDEQIVGEWIAALTELERALDADAIRALGDDPVLDEIAGPVADLDAATLRVIALLDPASGSPDYIGALVEARAAVERWHAAVPGMEDAWDGALIRWTAEWEQAVDDWEAEWAAAVADWEMEWEAAVAEWEAEWAAAVEEWQRQAEERRQRP